MNYGLGGSVLAEWVALGSQCRALVSLTVIGIAGSSSSSPVRIE
jgi:hypothetical protein